jgi:CheY-like chemotaxis protein/HPt (histidine-containing phosphotransfer) domain-containing protein
MRDFHAHLLLPRVLVIDDDMVSREVLATVLTMSGYTVHTAADGESAIALIEARESNPEVILMDTKMPGLSGVVLMDELRARSRAKVFAMSGSPPPDDVRRAADGFLLKPFGSDGLRKALEEKGPPIRLSTTPEGEEDAPVLKAETLAQFRESMTEPKVREIYMAVMADLTQRIELLDVAFKRQDEDAVHRIGHSIKGGCAMAGAAQVARLGALLESVTFDPGSDQLDNRMRLLRDLHAAASNLERILKVEFPA